MIFAPHVLRASPVVVSPGRFRMPFPMPYLWYRGNQFDNTEDGTEIPTLLDTSPNRFHADSLGSVGNRPVVFRNALNGKTAWRSIYNAPFSVTVPTLVPATLAYTVATVMRMNISSGDERPFATMGDGYGSGMRVGYDGLGGRVTFTVPNVGAYPATGTYWSSIALWHSICIVADAGAASRRALVYFDSDVARDTSAAATLNSNQTTIRVFGGATNLQPAADMAEFVFWNFPLSPAQVADWRTYVQETYKL